MYRHWCFTSFKDAEDIHIKPDDVDYLIIGNEVCPTTGRKHKQGYVCFKDRKRLSAVKKLEPTAHWEPRRGSVLQAINYCKKEGDYSEYGEVPCQERSNKNSFKYCLEKSKAGDFESIEESDYLGTYIRYKKTFDNYYIPDIDPLQHPRGVWIFGRPGCGKDTAVIKKYKPYIKGHNKWWDGYTDQPVILYSDFDANDAKWCGNYLKIWTDRYPFKGEIKGGVKTIHPIKFIITSNYTIDRLFNDDINMLLAIKRRCDIIDCDKKTMNSRPVFMPDSDLENII